jgi:hypothetical protein
MPNPFDFWAAGPYAYLGVAPGGIINASPRPSPIALFYGEHNYSTNNGWGSSHIMAKHGIFLNRTAKKYGMPQTDVAEIIWRKLQSSGNLYHTESNNKFKISLTISPESLLLMNWIERLRVFSVITIYAHPRQLDGQRLARYTGPKCPLGKKPVFSMKSEPEWCPFSLVPPGSAPY